jgi:hypothetical protein
MGESEPLLTHKTLDIYSKLVERDSSLDIWAVEKILVGNVKVHN